MMIAVLKDLAAFFDFLSSTQSLRILVIAGVLFGLWSGLQRAGFSLSTRVSAWLLVAAPLVAWFIFVWLLALSGAFQPRPGALPLLPVAVFAPVLLGLGLVTRSARIGAALDAVPPAWLVGIQSYRMIGGAAFLVQWGLGQVSATFALPSGIGDVLVGLLALPVALYLHFNEDRGRSVAVAWNAFGILDLVVTIMLGFLAASGRLPTLGAAPVPSGADYLRVMSPAFVLPFSSILHGVSLWQLRRLSKSDAAYERYRPSNS
jgi:hypothetical protein